MTSIRIELCGRLAVELSGRQIEEDLPGRQGGLVLAYLVLNRERPVGRGELIDLLWPENPPGDPEEAFSALLSKLRRALPEPLIEGRGELTLRLPEPAWVDYEAARRAVARAEERLDTGDWQGAWLCGNEASEVAARGFYARHEHPWVDERERELEDIRVRALECVAASGLELGQLRAAERAARTLTGLAPFRETAHAHLIRSLAGQGNVAEALQAYDHVRVLLRDELGAAPGRALQALHGELLEERAPADAAEPEPAEAPPAQATEERKLVSVLLARLAPRLELGDPERLRATLATYSDGISAIVERFGGTVERSEGPLLTAVFGAPRSHEDDPQRAVAAALRAQAVVAELGEQVTLHIGVASGEAFVAPGAGVAGGVTSVALRLQEQAPAGGVAVDRATRIATRRDFAYETLEGGGARPLREVPAAPRDGAPTALLGRGHELALLRGWHQAVVEAARPRLVTVIGEAGIGKTRLVDELVAGRPAVYRGRCLPYGEGITYWALREILWNAAGIALADSAAQAAGRLRLLTDRMLGEQDADRALYALATGAGISLPGNPLDDASPESIAQELGLAWPRFLSALAAVSPGAIVVIEDVHWAEPPLLEMVERIVARASGALMLVATARPEFSDERPHWAAMPGLLQLGLAPLGRDDARGLVEALLPEGTEELRDVVVSAAEGNPLFAQELVRHLTESGAADERSAAIPASVRAVLAARIDRLTDAEKGVLQAAAVVGRDFWAEPLEEFGAEAGARESLASLEEKGLVTARPVSSLPGQTELSFRHGLIREVAYNSVPITRRCMTHAGLAEWLERLAGERRGEFVDLLAHHYEAAARLAADAPLPDHDAARCEDIRARAVRTLLDAGHATWRRSGVEQAIRYADRALLLAADDSERLACLELRARTLHTAVRADKALAAYVAALDVARRSGDELAVRRLRAHATLLCARYAGAFASPGWEAVAIDLLAEGERDRVAEDGDAFEAAAQLVGRCAAPRWGARGRRIDRRDARRAVEIAEAIDSPYLLSNALEALNDAALLEGFCDSAEIAGWLLRAAGNMSDRVEAHESIVVASMCFLRACMPAQAQRVADEASRRAVGLTPHRRLHAAYAQASCLVTTGRLGALVEATADTPGLVTQEGEHTCPNGVLALAARTLALFEADDDDGASEVLDLLERATPRERGPSFAYRAAELLRPVIGLEATRERLALVPESPYASAHVHRLRVELQLAALCGDGAAAATLADEGRELARRACAPGLAAVADWSEAVAAGGPDAYAGANAAAERLFATGERYTAARLLADAIATLGPGVAPPDAAARAAKRLETMGAGRTASRMRLATGA